MEPSSMPCDECGTPCCLRHGLGIESLCTSWLSLEPSLPSSSTKPMTGSQKVTGSLCTSKWKKLKTWLARLFVANWFVSSKSKALFVWQSLTTYPHGLPTFKSCSFIFSWSFAFILSQICPRSEDPTKFKETDYPTRLPVGGPESKDKR